MKNILTFFIYPLLGCILVYLLVSFVVWDLNPVNWGMQLRAGTVFFMLFTYGLIVVIRVTL